MIALMLATLMAASVISASTASAPTKDAPIAYGVSYDWQMLDDDIEALTGIPLKDVLLDFSKSADDAGFELVLAEATTGTSSIIVEQYEDGTATWDDNGTSIDLTKRVTDVTLRHGIMVDTAFITDISDSYGGIDLVLSSDSENLLNIDAQLIEYVDANLMVHGLDMTASLNFEVSTIMELKGEIYGDGETLDVDIDFDAMVDYEVVSSNMELRFNEPQSYLVDMANATSESEVDWDCWEDHSGVDTNCSTTTGAYSTKASFDINLKGIPTEELGLAPGEWDIGLKDNVQDSGTFEDDMEFYESVEFSDAAAQTVTIDSDGTTASVIQAEHAPLPLPMGPMFGELMELAVEGSGDNPTIADAFEDELEDSILGMWAGGLAEGSSDDDYYEEEWKEDMYECDNGNHVYQWQVNDGEDNCGDGSDEGVPTMNIYFSDWTDEDGISASMSGENADNESNYTLSWGVMSESGDVLASGSGYIETGSSEKVYFYYSDFETTDSAPSNLKACLQVTMHHPTDNAKDIYGEDCEYLGIEPPVVDSNLHSDVSGYYFSAHNMDTSASWEASWVLTDSSGVTVESGSTAIPAGDYYWNYGDDFSTEVDEGEYCLTLTITAVGEGVSGEDTDCEEKEKEMEPSEKLRKIGEALAESTIPDKLEIFGENLENRLDKYEAQSAYDDAMAYALWDASQARYVGFQFLVDSGSNWHTLVGPSSDAYPVAPPTPINVEYIIGDSAADKAEEIDDQDTLSELVDVTKHNEQVEIVEEVAEAAADDTSSTGSSDDEGGLIPFVSPLATLAVIAAAGIAVGISRKDE